MSNEQQTNSLFLVGIDSLPSGSSLSPDSEDPAIAVAGQAAPTELEFDQELLSRLQQTGALGADQLDRAKRIHAKLGSDKSLLLVCQELGLVQHRDLAKALRNMNHKLQLGDMLVKLGYIRQVDLRNALNIQRDKAPDKSLGRVLVDNHFISEDRLLDALAVQLNLPKLEPVFSQIPSALLRLVTPRWCRRHMMVPVARVKGKILVAAAEPRSKETLHAAVETFGQQVLIGLANPKTLLDVIRAFESQSGLSQAEGKTRSVPVDMVNRLMAEAIEADASDVHLEPFGESVRIRFRCDGVMVPHATIDKKLAESVISRFKILAGADITEKRHHQDGRILFEDPASGQKVDLRASFFVTVHGEKLVLRVLSNKVDLLNVDELGLTPRAVDAFYHDVLDTPSGIILITGPTGSGKTTTLYSCVNYLNSIERSIITAEDPVEYLVEGVSQCSLNPKIDLTYRNTLPAMVRQDPDVIVLGEIRDNFSAEAAIQAALTGHKVLTTFHTEDTIGSLMRLMNMNIETFLISSTVVSVLAQRLLRKVCSHCASPVKPEPSLLARIGYSLDDVRGVSFVEGAGCDACRHSGYKGRIGVYELLVLNEEVKNAIMQSASAYDIRRVSFETSEMTTLLEEGLLKAAGGHTTLAEVIRHLPRMERPRPINELKRLTGVKL